LNGDSISKEIGVSETASKEQIDMSDPVNPHPKQLNRRDLGIMALAGALGATALGTPLSGFAQEETGSKAARPQSSGNKPKIKLASYFPADGTDDDLLFLKQIGADHVHITGKTQQVFTVEELRALKKRTSDAGFSAEMMPTALDHVMDDIILNRPGRDKSIEAFKTYVRALGSAGFDYIPRTFNLQGVTISGQAAVRGSQARDVDLSTSTLGAKNPLDRPGMGTAQGSVDTPLMGRVYGKEEIFQNYTYFMQQVVPVLEQEGVRLGIHPDDPPIPNMFGMARIFSNFEDFKKGLEVANSKNVGILLCWGTWLEGGTKMGIDLPGATRYFGAQKKIFECHFRNVSSPLPHFNETYPDTGYYDLYKAMKPLVDVNQDCVVQLDHSIPMVGGARTFYAYSMGYMRALLQRAQAEDAS
jgi:mannonate dehydratase